MQKNQIKKKFFKVVLLGDVATGKTSLTERFVNNKFSQRYRATIGADFLSKDIMMGNTVGTFQIWETAGSERFQSIGVHFYRGTDGCMLVYDVHNKKSFESLENWRTDILGMISGYDKPETFPFVCVGNKNDLTDTPTIPKTIVEEWCKQNSIPHYDVSAKDGTNVDQAFLKLALLVLANEREEPEVPNWRPLPPPAPPNECCTIL
eukprot:Phypoly_transcript_14242.p1 GENE.Phypoly_transcript_14242~~Phypoly_transcript_14242.p1  ORF type:complete len:206 (+),score=29.60 Phypoly_transcript_14242:163-780(+)